MGCLLPVTSCQSEDGRQATGNWQLATRRRDANMIARMRARAFLAALLLAPAAFAADSAETAKVAAWLRARPPVSAEQAHFGVLGGISFGTLGVDPVVRSGGPAAFYADSVRLNQALTMAGNRVSYLNALGAGGIHWSRDVQNFPWGMIEVARDQDRYELADAIVSAAQASGGRYVGTVMPYAGWELRAAGYAPTTDEQCQRLLTEDFFYLAFDQRMDRYKDLARWQRHLQRLVARYGDRVQYWQIHNEPEGDHCGLFRNDVAAFVDLMRVGYDTVHAACPTCNVLNGGAGIPLVRENETPAPPGTSFWRDFAALGGAQFVDVIAVHYNDGKSPSHGKIADFEYQVRRMRELLGTTKPVWVTEFGAVVGNGTLGNFAALSERDAAAWFIRFYAAGLAAGAQRFFSDAPAFVTMDGTTLLPFYVNKLMEAKLGGFTSAAKLADGQYRFVVNAREVFVLWGGVPASLTGSVICTDMYGIEATIDASLLPRSESFPVIVERLPARRRASR